MVMRPIERSSLSRRRLCKCAGLLFAGSQARGFGETVGPKSAANKVLVATLAGVAPYQQALEAMRARLAGKELEVVELEPTGKRLAQALDSGAAVAVAIGIEARGALGRAETKIPVVSTMVLLSAADDQNSGGGAPAQQAGNVFLDLEMTRIVEELAVHFPKWKRLGVLVDGDKRNAPSEGVLGQLQARGYNVQVTVCDRKAELAAKATAFRGKTDLVVLLPSSTLYDAKSVPPLLQAALENRLALVGYSPGILQAGTAFGVFPDYAELGVQASEMVVSQLAGKPGGEELARKVTFATNPRVLRLLGLNAPKT